jgi:hypothetical protein
VRFPDCTRPNVTAVELFQLFVNLFLRPSFHTKEKKEAWENVYGLWLR